MSADGVEIAGNLRLDDGFRASEGVDLSYARVGGQLTIVRAHLSAPSGNALMAQGMRVAGLFLFRDVEVAAGNVVLTGASAGGLADDTKSWPEDGRLMIDGFTYGNFVYTDASAKRRLRWLAKHSSNEFQPQPWQHLAEVLGRMGHRLDRGQVLMDMERRIRAQQRRDMESASGPAAWNRLRAGAHWTWEQVLRFLVGYGYRPWRAFYWSLPIMLLTALAADRVWHAGDFAPNSAPVLISADWQALARGDEVPNPAARWAADDGAGRDYETFKPALYAFDLVVPLINLGQKDAWAPSTSRGPWGRAFHWAMPAIEVLGWILTALGAAAVTGVIRRD